MELSLIVLKQIGIMVVLIAVGALCSKTKILDAQSNKKLSSLLLNVVNPLVIVTAYQTEYSVKLFHGFLWAFLISVISYCIAIAGSFLFIRTKDDVQRSVERFSMIYSNCGFMGIPLINGLFGAEGVIYVTAYLTIFNLFVWSHGYIVMKGEFSLESLKKAVLSPAVIATLLGFTLFMLRLSIPDIPLRAIEYLGSMNTPLAMLISGVTIAQSRVLRWLKSPKLYLTAMLKLLIIPAITILVTRWLPVPQEVFVTIIVVSACPSATIGTLFAVKFDRGAEYASAIFSFTTLACAITVPIITLLATL